MKQLGAKIHKSEFFASELIRAFISHRPKMKILFSATSDREHNIRKGFRFLSHQLTFAAFTPETIMAHDMVIPLTMEDLRILTQHRQLIKNNPIPIPSTEVINICDDKYLFGKTLIEKGFGHLVPNIGNDLPYPYMLKKKIAHSGDNCYIISNSEQEHKFKEVLKNRDYFCQQIVSGKNEYAAHIVFKDHKIISSINTKYIFPGDEFVKGKDQFICTTLAECPYLDTFAAVLDAIGFEGLCCFNYKVIDDNPYLLEINPRFGGSLSSFFFSFIRQLKFEERVHISHRIKSLFADRNIRKAG